MSQFRNLMMTKIGEGGNPWDRYIQDGLIFQLDCDTEWSPSLWKDLKSGSEFQGVNIKNASHAPLFFGTSYYAGTQPTSPKMLSTIEVMYCPITTQYHFIFSPITANVGVMFRSDGFNLAGTTNTPVFGYSDVLGRNLSVSINANACCVNGEVLNVVGSDYWGYNSGTKALIGTRNLTFQYPLIGIIYAIRIYNRILTVDEMKANQAIDLERFGNR